MSLKLLEFLQHNPTIDHHTDDRRIEIEINGSSDHLLQSTEVAQPQSNSKDHSPRHSVDPLFPLDPSHPIEKRHNRAQKHPLCHHRFKLPIRLMKHENIWFQADIFIWGGFARRYGDWNAGITDDFAVQGSL
ncbi:hypothetical protein HYALB_00013371 [Hymenoscyphus albidus]|uniref:Uncharacterized protein n=1 Tax=Hymenoscyphus albidus TaxID=595503 RepID=A0A9N9LR56_9HELO|nr:hypothetical protein HYALB_00013371 [Hymenoscyphus albidus]